MLFSLIYIFRLQKNVPVPVSLILVVNSRVCVMRNWVLPVSAADTRLIYIFSSSITIIVDVIIIIVIIVTILLLFVPTTKLACCVRPSVLKTTK